MQLDELVPESRRVRVPCSWHLNTFPLQSKGVHETGGTPASRHFQTLASPLPHLKPSSSDRAVHGVLRSSLLYLSLSLKTNRTEYCRLLQGVRETGDWEAWLDFFLTGVAETANQAFETPRGSWTCSKRIANAPPRTAPRLLPFMRKHQTKRRRNRRC